MTPEQKEYVERKKNEAERLQNEHIATASDFSLDDILMLSDIIYEQEEEIRAGAHLVAQASDKIFDYEAKIKEQKAEIDKWKKNFQKCFIALQKEENNDRRKTQRIQP